MKIRYVFVALALVATAACQSSPTASRAEDSSATGIEARLDGATTPPDTTTARAGSGWAGSGN